MDIDEPEEARAHPPTGRPLLLALAALGVLTVTSWLVSYLPLGVLHTPVALAIAAGKAVIVAVAFMELPRASAPARITAVVTVAFIALLCAGTVADLAFR